MPKKTKWVIAAALIAAIGLLMVVAGCGKTENSAGNKEEPVQEAGLEIMGLPATYEDEKTYEVFTIRSYYLADDKAKEPLKIAESFGFEICDYSLDIDDDGQNELCCNCVYGGDGVAEFRGYKLIDKAVHVGYIDRSMVDMEDFNDYGASAFQSSYDPETGDIIVCYASGKDYEPKKVSVEASCLQYELYCELPE